MTQKRLFFSLLGFPLFFVKTFIINEYTFYFMFKVDVTLFFLLTVVLKIAWTALCPRKALTERQSPSLRKTPSDTQPSRRNTRFLVKWAWDPRDDTDLHRVVTTIERIVKGSLIRAKLHKKFASAFIFLCQTLPLMEQNNHVVRGSLITVHTRKAN